MPIANVSHTCEAVHGTGWALALPLISTIPSQHSGLLGHRAPDAPADAAGHPLVTVATPNTPGAAPVPVAPVRVPPVRVPPACAARVPLACGVPPDPKKCAPASSAATTTRTRPPPTAAARVGSTSRPWRRMASSPGGAPGTSATGWLCRDTIAASPGAGSPAGKRGGRPASSMDKVAARE
jgi:hypothetical protein